MRILRPLSIVVLFLLLLPQVAGTGRIETGKYYYGIEINGVLCGYAEIETSPMEKNGREMVLLKHRAFMMLKALGAQFNSEVKLTYHIDPETGQFDYHDSDVVQGRTKLDSKIYIEADTAYFTSSLADEGMRIALPPDATLENTRFHLHLKRDFVDGGLEEKTYKVFDVREVAVLDLTYTKTGTETLELAGRKYEAVILDVLNHKNGLKHTLWIDPANGTVLKTKVLDDRIIYLADASVKKRIEVANLDEDIAQKTNVQIADIAGITYMKVKAVIEPVGLRPTPTSLNIPGQRFEGTIEENLIEGVFEIGHPHYDGTNAPPFPPDFSGDEALKEYLEAGKFIESDDRVLIEKAQEITQGSKDSWEAAVQLSEWVATEIGYAIPGGLTARNTYDIGAGECGAHSMLLAAFCRCVGIPARVIWGCMYIPNFGGAFGQHGWNEIYMGEAGWIPVDATVSESDFLDSGHIRLGVLDAANIQLNAKSMEVLDYRIGSGEAASAEALSTYDPYVGNFTNPEKDRTFEVFVKDGALTVDIPDRLQLALSDPDEEGRWYAKISKRLFVIFTNDENGKATEMLIHELVPMSKKSAPEEIDESVPDEYRPYLGVYLLAQLNAEFTIRYQDGGLVIDNTLDNSTVRLQPPDETGKWVDEFDKNSVTFEHDSEGKVTKMILDSVSTFSR